MIGSFFNKWFAEFFDYCYQLQKGVPPNTTNSYASEFWTDSSFQNARLHRLLCIYTSIATTHSHLQKCQWLCSYNSLMAFGLWLVYEHPVWHLVFKKKLQCITSYLGTLSRLYRSAPCFIQTLCYKYEYIHT